ncbi:stearoyl-CoA desaturase 5-like [Tubulanus polymorphus]|uniref:stearoyl-CoA desaturase 5-like n=1 Tax=Tubulanus polymorphus TaxID=672921 RepID=UPI003DA24C4F
MAPRIREGSAIVDATKPDSYTPDLDLVNEAEASILQQEGKLPPRKIVWRNVILFTYLHISAIFGIYYAIFHAKWRTLFFAGVFYFFGALGITAGAHRLWAHRSYKAKLPLRIFLAICQTIAFQNHIYEWSRDHRVHHKYSETNADPHNAKRGLFFSHMGWLLVRKHPDVIAKGRTLDYTDLLKDPVVVIQKKFYLPFVLLSCFAIPTVIPHIVWGESLVTSFLVCLLRYTMTLHWTWCVNSLAHMYGNRPYDKFINPAENMFVSFWAIGEGFHNYHHTFPMDYSTSEFGWKLNPTTFFLDIMAYFGQAYDRKKIPLDVVRRRALRTGDPSLRAQQ